MKYKQNFTFKALAFVWLFISASSMAFAHTTVMDMDKLGSSASAALFLTLGFTHILPSGLDHILFILGLFLLNPKFKPLLQQVTTFTVAHTITLGLSAYKIIHLPAAIVEPVIALSIVFVAAENIFTAQLHKARLGIVFLFGLIHGIGFASVLSEIGMPSNSFFSSLLLFNVGVELGQITVVLVAWFLLAKWFAAKPYYRRFIVIPTSVIISAIALFWFIERLNFGESRKNIVAVVFVEHAMKMNNDSLQIQSENETRFWRKRIEPGRADYTNRMRYAAALIQRFHITADINDVRKSDSILFKVAETFKSTEAAPYLALCLNAILQHQFFQADSFLTLARKIGIKKYESAAAGFDVNFELGNISFAVSEMKKIENKNDYGYQFRCSKLMHYKGMLDSSISAMKAAYELAASNNVLQQAALSNLGDLYLHNNDAGQAAECYTRCIAKNPSNLHAYIGLARIALLHDDNGLLAEKILLFVADKSKSPEALFNLVAVAQQEMNKNLELLYAKKLVQAVSNVHFGNMYNKYLLQVYTGVLPDAEKAMNITTAELNFRNTPQTQAWYAWALYNQGNKQGALKLFREKISGHPLEALEQYWMGKILKAEGQSGLAMQYFYEAAKSRYDLSPAINLDLDELLN